MSSTGKTTGLKDEKVEAMPFEAALKKLETIVDSMEEGELPLVLKISGTMPTERLFHELTTRQFNTSARGKIKVEAKTEYKSRGNKSPDFADSLTLLIHGVRLNVAGPVGTAEKGSGSDEALNRFRPRTDATNRFEYID